MEINEDEVDHRTGQEDRVRRASEAVEVARQSAGPVKRPEKNTELLTALERYLVAAHGLGRSQDAVAAARGSDLAEAMTAMDEAVVWYRGLADRNPDQFAGHLDGALAMREQLHTHLQMPGTL